MERRDDEQARARRASGNRALLAFVSLVAVPIAPFVMIAAIAALPRERRLGIPLGNTLAAIAFSAFATLYGAALVGTLGWAGWSIANRPCALVVANGHDEDEVVVELDGVEVATVPAGESTVIDVEPGEHRVFGRVGRRSLGRTHLVAFAAGDRKLWNPDWKARFLVWGSYSSEWRPLPREEWIDLAPYRHVLGHAAPFALARTSELAWGRSEPVTIAVDNPYDVPIEVTIDDATHTIGPTQWQELWVREGPHEIRVVAESPGEPIVVFESRVETGDYSAFLLDPSAESGYVVCRELEDGSLVLEEELAPRAWRDVSEHEEILDAATPRSDLETAEPTRVRWSEAGCDG